MMKFWFVVFAEISLLLGIRQTRESISVWLKKMLKMRQPKKGFKVKMKYKSQGWRPTDMTALKGSPFPIESLHKKCIDFAFICKKGFLKKPCSKSIWSTNMPQSNATLCSTNVRVFRQIIMTYFENFIHFETTR